MFSAGGCDAELLKPGAVRLEKGAVLSMEINFFFNFHWSITAWALQVMVVVKNPSAKAGDVRDTSNGSGGFDPWVGGRSPGGGHGNPLQYSCLEHPHGQRSLAGYRVRRQEWVMT